MLAIGWLHGGRVLECGAVIGWLNEGVSAVMGLIGWLHEGVSVNNDWQPGQQRLASLLNGWRPVIGWLCEGVSKGGVQH